MWARCFHHRSTRSKGSLAPQCSTKPELQGFRGKNAFTDVGCLRCVLLRSGCASQIPCARLGLSCPGTRSMCRRCCWMARRFSLSADANRPAIVALATSAALAATALLVRQQAYRAERIHPPRGSFINLDGVRVHYLERGSGPPLVLLHGNGSMALDFEISGLLDILSRSYRVLAFDRPGYGYSERPRDRVWTPRAQAELLRLALKQLQVHRPTVLGHSWGTLVALDLALEYPEFVRGLILLSGYYYPTARADALLFAPPAVPIVGDLLRYTISPILGRLIAWPLIRKTFAPSEVPPSFKLRFPVNLTVRPWQIRASAEEAAIMVPAAATYQKRYHEIKAPTILLAGAGDRIVSVEKQSLRLHRDLPQAELHVLPGLGHMLHHFAQKRVSAAVDSVTMQ